MISLSNPTYTHIMADAADCHRCFIIVSTNKNM